MRLVAKRKWRLLIIGMLVVLIVVGRSFFSAYFVQPIVLFLWAAWRVMASVNQNVYWVLLLTAGFIPLVWMIASSNGITAESAYCQDPLPPDRVTYWEQLLAGSHGSLRAHGRFREAWGKLLFSVSAHARRSGSDDSSGDDFDPIESLPAQLRWIVGRTGEPRREPRIQKLVMLLPAPILQRLRQISKADAPWIHDSLHWMESELDMPDDD